MGKGKKDYELKRVLQNGTKTIQPHQQKMLDSVLYQLKTMQDKFVFDCLKELVPSIDMQHFRENPAIYAEKFGNDFQVNTRFDENNSMMYITEFLVKGNVYKRMALNLSH